MACVGSPYDGQKMSTDARPGMFVLVVIQIGRAARARTHGLGSDSEPRSRPTSVTGEAGSRWRRFLFTNDRAKKTFREAMEGNRNFIKSIAPINYFNRRSPRGTLLFVVPGVETLLTHSGSSAGCIHRPGLLDHAQQACSPMSSGIPACG